MESGDNKSQTTPTPDPTPPAPTPTSAPPTNRPFKGRYSCLNDPNLAPARIYIGNLPETITDEFLRNRFGTYGQIMDILIKNGFAFVQFMAKDSAMEAIKNENKSQLLDKIIAVRTAVKKGAAQAGNDGPPPQMTSDNIPNAPPMAGNSGPVAPKIGPMQKMSPKFIHKASSNHIEIMAMSRQVTKYAENIESYLKERDLKVDLLYPKPEYSMPELLESIKYRGTLFALEVNHENENNETVTVYMLYDETIKWYKNMPIQEALIKIQSCTEKYLSDNNLLGLGSNNYGNNSDLPSNNINTIEDMELHLSNLIRAQKLTVAEMDIFVEKCRKMRQALAVLENPINPEPEPEIPEEDPAELELQKKINNIVNAENYLDKLIGREPFEMTKERLELLKDPKIERALDTLLQPEIFSTLDLKFIEKY